MKKTLLTIAFAAISFFGFGQSTTTYTDNLVVSVNEESSEPQETNIIVTKNADGTYTLALNNFALGAGEDAMGVGNIELTNIVATEENGIKTFTINQNITITEGDAEGVDMWIGPLLGEVPINLNGKMTADKLYCTIDIDMMESLEQIIKVTFGTDEFTGSSISKVKTADALVNVYNLVGVAVKTNVKASEALVGLKKGIYIVNGKKFTKK